MRAGRARRSEGYETDGPGTADQRGTSETDVGSVDAVEDDAKGLEKGSLRVCQVVRNSIAIALASSSSPTPLNEQRVLYKEEGGALDLLV